MLVTKTKCPVRLAKPRVGDQRRYKKNKNPPKNNIKQACVHVAHNSIPPFLARPLNSTKSSACDESGTDTGNPPRGQQLVTCASKVHSTLLCCTFCFLESSCLIRAGYSVQPGLAGRPAGCSLLEESNSSRTLTFLLALLHP